MKAFRVRLLAPLCVSASSALLLAPRYARAEPSPADKSLATSLFKEGRALVDQGHVAEGCRKLEESQRLDPGGGTLLNLALCHEKEGRTASAWAEFTEALGMAKRDDRPQRAEFARAHIAQLESTLSRLVIQVPHGAETPDLEIKRDGGMIGRAAWGSAMPVDPGEHVVEASAQGKVTWKETVTLGAKGDTKTVIVPLLENAAAAGAGNPGGSPTSSGSLGPASTPAAAGGDGTTNADSGAAGAPAARSSGPSPAAWVALGIGAVAAGAGTYFGLRAMSLKNDADRDCNNSDVCHGNGAQENSDAIKSANLATAGVAVGLVGIGFGTYLLIATSGPARPAVAAPGTSRRWKVDGAGLSLAGNGGAKITISGRF